MVPDIKKNECPITSAVSYRKISEEHAQNAYWKQVCMHVEKS